MAAVSFVGLAQAFNMSSQFASLLRGRVETASSTLFSWISGEGHDIDLSGSGFAFDAKGVPTGGTVSQLRMDLGNNSESLPDLRIAGVSFDLSSLAPLVNGGLSAEAQNDLIWRAVLAGDDAIDFGTAATRSGFAIRFFADGRNITDDATLFGGDDTMSGDIGGSIDVTQSAQVSGDANIVSAGTLYGGNDRITVTGTAAGSAVHGDAVAVYGFLAGGDDVLSVKAGGVVASIFGDAALLGEGGIATGGGDTITLGAGGTAVGDIADVAGRLSGGNDRINGGARADTIYGDAITLSATGSLRGGADTINGGAGNDLIFGDWKTAAGLARGGSDRLYGGIGNDTVYGNGGNDLLDGGTGADKLKGGEGDDSFQFAAATGSSNIDIIIDFANTSGNNDSILLARSVFAVLMGASGAALTSDQFVANASGSATNQLQHIIYETDTGKLFFDADGNKPGGVAAVQFATISNFAGIAGTALAAGDFILV